MRIRFGSMLLALALGGTPAGADAAEKYLGKFGDWLAYRTGDGADTVCFVATLPTKTEGRAAKRGEATLMIAHFPRHKAFGRVQIKAGLPLKKGTAVLLAVGDKEFSLTAEGDSAFGDDTRAHAEIAAALKAGTAATATLTPAAGAKLVDRFSLSGVSAALAEIDKVCKR